MPCNHASNTKVALTFDDGTMSLVAAFDNETCLLYHFIMCSMVNRHASYVEAMPFGVLPDLPDHMVHGLIIHKTRSSEVCEHAQAIISAAASTGTQLTYFNADRLRRALRAAGNIVKPSEIPKVLSYVITDGKYEDLHDLHLILLSDGSVQQIKWALPGSQTYFVFTDNKSKSIFHLMSSKKHELVKHTQA